MGLFSRLLEFATVKDKLEFSTPFSSYWATQTINFNNGSTKPVINNLSTNTYEWEKDRLDLRLSKFVWFGLRREDRIFINSKFYEIIL